MQDKFEASRKISDEKIKKLTKDLTEMITSITDQIKNLKSSPDKKDSPTDQVLTPSPPATRPGNGRRTDRVSHSYEQTKDI